MSDLNPTVRDSELKITHIEETDIGDPTTSTFDVYLERPYYVHVKKNGDIASGMYCNLMTRNNISFSKGLVIKKHMINKRLSQEDEDEEEEDQPMELEDTETNPGTSSTVSKRLKNKKRRCTFL
mgnify:CR=1 FL=1